MGLGESRICWIWASSGSDGFGGAPEFGGLWRDQDLVGFRAFCSDKVLKVLFFVADAHGMHEEQQVFSDLVILQMEESFGTIWAKTAAIMKFGADYFQGRIGGIGDGQTEAATPIA